MRDLTQNLTTRVLDNHVPSALPLHPVNPDNACPLRITAAAGTLFLHIISPLCNIPHCYIPQKLGSYLSSNVAGCPCVTHSLDLQVLSIPPAFIMSQDQTLKPSSIRYSFLLPSVQPCHLLIHFFSTKILYIPKDFIDNISFYPGVPYFAYIFLFHFQ